MRLSFGVKAGVFLFINLIIITYLLRSVWTLLSLLVLDGSNDAILLAQLPAPGSDLIEKMPQLIPKIIHQTYKNETIPEVWRDAQQSCIALHKDYEYIMWTDATARDFIQLEYPWFLETFDSYPFNIQRADALRYFVLAHYGGIYIDLDDGCQRRLDPLLAYPAWVRRTKPTGISNDVMGAVPQHPFFVEVIDSLQRYKKDWVSPYVTTMATTGPLFLSLVWRHYNKVERYDEERVRILFPDSYMSHSWSFFTHHLGNSWHQSDAQLLFWMSKNWAQLTVLGFVVGGIVITMLWFVYNRLINSPKSQDGTVPRRRSFLNFKPLWMFKGRRDSDYELVSRCEA